MINAVNQDKGIIMTFQIVMACATAQVSNFMK